MFLRKDELLEERKNASQRERKKERVKEKEGPSQAAVLGRFAQKRIVTQKCDHRDLEVLPGSLLYRLDKFNL